jgi:excisionase family DNA binding protein
MKQLLTIAEAAAEIGSRTKTYELIGLGKLRAVKLGARTKIDAESLRAFIAALPEAQIAPPRRRAGAR